MMSLFRDPIFLFALALFLSSTGFLIWIIQQLRFPEEDDYSESSDEETPEFPRPEPLPYAAVPPPSSWTAPSSPTPPPVQSMPAGRQGEGNANGDNLIQLVDQRILGLAQRMDKLETVFQQVARSLESSKNIPSPLSAPQIEEMKKNMDEVKSLLTGIRDGGEDVLAGLNQKMDVIQKVIVNLVSDFDVEKTETPKAGR